MTLLIEWIEKAQMMVEVQLHERTKELLADAALGEQSMDTTIRRLLEAEYLRQLARYQRAKQMLSLTYAMTFEEFTDGRVVKERGYS